MAESEITPTPETPAKAVEPDPTKSVKIADPDLIVFEDSSIPVEFMTELLFEQVGGQELINVARHDLLNGQRKSYNLVGNTDKIEEIFNSKNFIKIPGTLQEKFKNFGIRLGSHVPANGTGPAAYYVGPLGAFGCIDYPVVDRYDDTLIACYPSYEQAQNAIDNDLAPQRPTVYSDTETGDVVVDVTRMKNNEQVEIEILTRGARRNDTIY